MLRKSLLILIIALSSLMARELVIPNANGTVHLNISSTDVNRLVFPYAITFKAYSKEKDLMILVKDKELYIKFTPYKKQEVVTIKDKIVTKDTNRNLIYNKSKPAEIFVVTKEKTYSLILHPAKVEATTIYFTEPLKQKEKQIKKLLNKEEVYVDLLANKIIKPILKYNKLSGYEKKEKNILIGNVYVKSLHTKIKVIYKTLFKGYKYNAYIFDLINIDNTIYTIPDVRDVLNKILPYINKHKLLAYSIFYNNHIYKLLPKKSAKLVIVTDGDIK